jgi:hypothetical protein
MRKPRISLLRAVAPLGDVSSGERGYNRREEGGT